MQIPFSVDPTFAFFLALPAVAFVFLLIPFLLGRAFLNAVVSIFRSSEE